jgi:hypothetical protein
MMFPEIYGVRGQTTAPYDGFAREEDQTISILDLDFGLHIRPSSGQPLAGGRLRVGSAIQNPKSRSKIDVFHIPTETKKECNPKSKI